MSFEATKCTYSISITGSERKKPQILVSIDRVPENTRDGIVLKTEKGQFYVDREGTTTLYFTLFAGRRFVSTPVSTVVRVYKSKPEAPAINQFSIRDGNVVLSLKSQSESINDYLVKAGKIVYHSENGFFLIPVNQSLETPIYCYSVRKDGVMSLPIKLNVNFSVNEKPSFDLKLPANYSGGKIPAEFHDDWTVPSKLVIEASVDGKIPLLFDGTALFPLYEIPSGEHLIHVKVVDQMGLSSEASFRIMVEKNLRDEIAELYIEEGGTFRKASWSLPEPIQNAVIQIMQNGKWSDIIEVNSNGSVRIPSKYISETGDIYRIAPEGGEISFLPSVPVFAKLEQSRRVTSNYIISLYGKDVTLPSGGSYSFQGNIAVKSGTLLRIESTTNVYLSRKSVLLVNGVLEIDGRRGKVNISSSGSPATLYVGKNGTLIARNVDFNNVKLVVNEGSVVVLENCEIDSEVHLKASTVQVYNSNIRETLKIDDSDELYLYNTELLNGLEVANVRRAIVLNSRFELRKGIITNSEIKVFGTEFSANELQITNSSHASFYNCVFYAVQSSISNASELYLESVKPKDNQKISLDSFSRVILSDKLKEKLHIEKDDTSEIFFHSGD
ncbi:hypothetical protein [Kosmotoga pacifica]|nr:hypothetical protein [Kosmotoga pacifica]